MIEYFFENPYISSMAISVVSIISASIVVKLEKRNAQKQIFQERGKLSAEYAKRNEALSAEYVRHHKSIEQALSAEYVRHHKSIEQSLSAEYAKRNEALSAKYEKLTNDLDSNINNLLGVSYGELNELSKDPKFSRLSCCYLRRAKGYIARLEKLNKKRIAQFEQKPVTTTAASLIKKDHLQTPFSIQERLHREIEICKQKAIDLQISPPIGVEPVECEIIRVIDGDTFLVSVDSNTFRLRVAGFDTPEVCHPTKGFGHWGIQASAAAESFVASGKSFKVFLDKKSFKQYGLFNDRYGRIVGHIVIDDVLLGQMMLSEGHAELVDFFPIDEEILNQYRLAEFAAKQENLGMWKDINEFRLMKKVNAAREKKYNFQEIVETNFQIDFTKEIIKKIFVDMIGNTVVRSKNGSGKVHNHGCRYLKTIKEAEEIDIDEAWIEENANNLLPCKVCNGDDIISELTR